MHENFLIWGAPGSGKSFFIQEIARSAGPQIKYHELNLARQSRQEFKDALANVSSTGPALCLVDEVDARGDETWPYEELFSHLDRNLKPDASLVFVLIGSGSAGLQGLVSRIQRRSKGQDLADRIPIHHRFEIPPLTLEDKVIVVCSQVREASRGTGEIVTEIEKLGLYYVLLAEGLNSPRQLRDLAVAAAQRKPAHEPRLRYDDLFNRGDRRRNDFWGRHQDAVDDLADRFVLVSM